MLGRLANRSPEAARAALDRRERIIRSRQNCLTFSHFVQEAWHVLEPCTLLHWGNAMESMAWHLQGITDGEITHLIINVPPGFMKSLMASVFWPAYEWGPRGMGHLRHLSASYKEDHARRDARKTRYLVESPWFQERWGRSVWIERGGEADFETNLKGWRKARPIGSLTGDRGDRLIIDDPHSTEMADSEVSRDRTERLIRESLGTRTNDPLRSANVLIMQRLNEADATGVLLDLKEDYVHLCLPMEYEPERRCSTAIGFEDWRREEGELLDPVRFPAEVVERLKRRMGAYAVAGQFQQRPSPRGGAIFQRDWFEIVDSVPEKGLKARSWDLAATVAEGSGDPDWTVGLLGSRGPDGVKYIRDMVRFRADPAGVVARLLSTAQNDGYGVTQRIPQDPGSAGKINADYLTRELRRMGRNSRFQTVTGDKLSRALPAVADASCGRIKLVRGAWNDVFLDEITAFPKGRHDDIVDALSDLHDELTRWDTYDLSGVS